MGVAADYRYSLPIEGIPAGRAGLTPRLSLQYSSRGGDRSTLGVGWSVAYGGSEIARCPRTWNLDGTTDSPHFQPESDALCLDGNRLRQVSGGAPMAEGTVYATHDDSYSRIIAGPASQSEAPASFTCHTKAGTTRTYAALFATRLPEPPAGGSSAEDEPLFDLSQSLVTPVWVLTEERDKSGNTVEYFYDVESKTQAPYDFEYRIKSIAFAGKKDSKGTSKRRPSARSSSSTGRRPSARISSSTTGAGCATG